MWPGNRFPTVTGAGGVWMWAQERGCGSVLVSRKECEAFAGQMCLSMHCVHECTLGLPIVVIIVPEGSVRFLGSG